MTIADLKEHSWVNKETATQEEIIEEME